MKLVSTLLLALPLASLAELSNGHQSDEVGSRWGFTMAADPLGDIILIIFIS